MHYALYTMYVLHARVKCGSPRLITSKHVQRTTINRYNGRLSNEGRYECIETVFMWIYFNTFGTLFVVDLR